MSQKATGVEWNAVSIEDEDRKHLKMVTGLKMAEVILADWVGLPFKSCPSLRTLWQCDSQWRFFPASFPDIKCLYGCAQANTWVEL